MIDINATVPSCTSDWLPMYVLTVYDASCGSSILWNSQTFMLDCTEAEIHALESLNMHMDAPLLDVIKQTNQFLVPCWSECHPIY